MSAFETWWADNVPELYALDRNRAWVARQAWNAATEKSMRENLALNREKEAERDRLLAIMETIANNHDCDPRAEAREALEGKP